MKIARIICCELDSTLRPTMNRGFDIIPAQAGIDTIRFFAGFGVVDSNQQATLSKFFSFFILRDADSSFLFIKHLGTFNWA